MGGRGFVNKNVSKKFDMPESAYEKKQLDSYIRIAAKFYGFVPIGRCTHERLRYFICSTGKHSGKFIVYDRQNMTVTGHCCRLNGLTCDINLFRKSKNNCPDRYEKFKQWVHRINRESGNAKRQYPPLSMIADVMKISYSNADLWVKRLKKQLKAVDQSKNMDGMCLFSV